jgi:hypothetical protein
MHQQDKARSNMPDICFVFESQLVRIHSELHRLSLDEFFGTREKIRRLLFLDELKKFLMAEPLTQYHVNGLGYRHFVVYQSTDSVAEVCGPWSKSCWELIHVLKMQSVVT